MLSGCPGYLLLGLVALPHYYSWPSVKSSMSVSILAVSVVTASGHSQFPGSSSSSWHVLGECQITFLTSCFPLFTLLLRNLSGNYITLFLSCLKENQEKPSGYQIMKAFQRLRHLRLPKLYFLGQVIWFCPFDSYLCHTGSRSGEACLRAFCLMWATGPEL